jgi:hypothetical protein
MLILSPLLCPRELLESVNVCSEEVLLFVTISVLTAGLPFATFAKCTLPSEWTLTSSVRSHNTSQVVVQCSKACPEGVICMESNLSSILQAMSISLCCLVIFVNYFYAPQLALGSHLVHKAGTSEHYWFTSRARLFWWIWATLFPQLKIRESSRLPKQQQGKFAPTIWPDNEISQTWMHTAPLSIQKS